MSEIFVSVLVKKLNEDAVIPKQTKAGDACVDLHSVVDVEIQPGETKLISTGLAMAIPEGFELQIRPRSGLSVKTDMWIKNSPGTIDSGYRGDIKVIVKNTGNAALKITKGMRLCQAALRQVFMPIFQEVTKLPDSERKDSGFGSSGV